MYELVLYKRVRAALVHYRRTVCVPRARKREGTHLESKPHAALIGDILAESIEPIDVRAAIPVGHLGAVGVILVSEAPCAVVKLFERLRVPPVLLVPVLVE